MPELLPPQEIPFLRPGGFEKDGDITTALRKAVHYQRSGDFQKAGQIYTDILLEYPENDEALHLLGLVAHEGGDNQQAMRLMRKAIEIAPRNPVYLSNLGTLLLRTGHIGEAITWLMKSLALSPETGETWYCLGDAFKDQGKPDEAIDCYDKAIAFAPHLHAVYGQLYNELQRTCIWDRLRILERQLNILTEEALSHFEKAPERPLINVGRDPNPARNFAVAKSWTHDLSCMQRGAAPTFSYDHLKKDKKNYHRLSFKRFQRTCCGPFDRRSFQST